MPVARRLLGIVALACALSASPAAGQEERARSDAAPADTLAADHPNRVPYETDRSLVYHVLAAPAYLLHGTTRPLGWTVKYLERNFPALFEPQAPTKGVLPLLELGGPVGISGGAALFHHDFLGRGHDVRLEGIIGARNYWETEFSYTVPDPVGPASTFHFESELSTNPEARFFLQGNDSNRARDETRHYVQAFDAAVSLDGRPRERLALGGRLRYEHVETKPADGQLGERLPRDLPGLGTVDLLTTTARAAWDLTRSDRLNGAARRYAGIKVLTEASYTHDLAGGEHRFVHLVNEVQGYVPVGLFPRTRRLAVRARVTSVEPVGGGDDVPFVKLPGLGGQESLRGFVFDRFIDDNLLLLNAEYRYPIWDRWDFVVFADAGQVFESFDQLAADRFRWSYGGGVHLLSGSGLAFRFEVAGSADGVRSLLTVTPAFD